MYAAVSYNPVGVGKALLGEKKEDSRMEQDSLSRSCRWHPPGIL